MEYRNLDAQKTQEQIGTTNCGKSCVHDNLVLRKTMMERHKNLVVWDSQTVITEPDRYTDEQGADDVDEEDSTDEKITIFV